MWSQVAGPAAGALASALRLNWIVLDAFRDNTYEGTFGENGFGAKASADLLKTQGKGVRHEKNKKKRGSYRGGAIDISAVNSTKMTFADDWGD